MKLKRFLLRYFPPGLTIEYEQSGQRRSRTLDLLTLTPYSDVDAMVTLIIQHDAMLKESRRPQLRRLIESMSLVHHL